MICHKCFFFFFTIMWSHLSCFQLYTLRKSLTGHIYLNYLKVSPKSRIARFSFSTYCQFFFLQGACILSPSQRKWMWIACQSQVSIWISQALTLSSCLDSWISSRYDLNVHILDDYWCQANFPVLVVIYYTFWWSFFFFSNTCLCGVISVVELVYNDP